MFCPILHSLELNCSVKSDVFVSAGITAVDFTNKFHIFAVCTVCLICFSECMSGEPCATQNPSTYSCMNSSISFIRHLTFKAFMSRDSLFARSACYVTSVSSTSYSFRQSSRSILLLHMPFRYSIPYLWIEVILLSSLSRTDDFFVVHTCVVLLSCLDELKLCRNLSSAQTSPVTNLVLLYDRSIWSTENPKIKKFRRNSLTNELSKNTARHRRECEAVTIEQEMTWSKWVWTPRKSSLSRSLMIGALLWSDDGTRKMWKQRSTVHNVTIIVR